MLGTFRDITSDQKFELNSAISGQLINEQKVEVILQYGNQTKNQSKENTDYNIWRIREHQH